MTKTELEKTVRRYKDNGEILTAENYIRNFGPQIQGYDVEEAVYKLKQNMKPEKETKEE